jgi:hypothetical protein
MEELGRSLTWKTKCFLRSTCIETVFAHTNGYGDFVLFDKLGWPWPIHECYLDRFGHHVRRTRGVPYEAPLDINWDSVTPITPDANSSRKRFSFVGTVTNIEMGFLSKSKEFQELSKTTQAEVRKILNGRTGVFSVVTGDGAEYTAFVDLDETQIEFRDIVACDLKAIELFNKSVFVVTKIETFNREDDD